MPYCVCAVIVTGHALDLDNDKKYYQQKILLWNTVNLVRVQGSGFRVQGLTPV